MEKNHFPILPIYKQQVLFQFQFQFHYYKLDSQALEQYILYKSKMED